MNIYEYKGIIGILADVKRVNTVEPIACINGIGFYNIIDLSIECDDTLLCYDDYLGGGYCGGEITIHEVKDLLNGGSKIKEWVSKEYVKNVKDFDG